MLLSTTIKSILGMHDNTKQSKRSIRWIDMKSASHSAVWEDGGTPTPPPSLGLVMAAIIMPCQNAVCGESIYDPIISHREYWVSLRRLCLLPCIRVHSCRERVTLVGQAALKDGVES